MLPTEDYGIMRRVKEIIFPAPTAAEMGFTRHWGKFASRSLPPGSGKTLKVKSSRSELLEERSSRSELFRTLLGHEPITVFFDEAEKLLRRDPPKPRTRITYANHKWYAGTPAYPNNKWFRILGLSLR